MFDFQKLEVYQKSKTFCKKITDLIKSSKFDKVTNDQLRRASFSIMLNIAEGSSRFSNKDRKNFLVISRKDNLSYRFVRLIQGGTSFLSYLNPRVGIFLIDHTVRLTVYQGMFMEG